MSRLAQGFQVDDSELREYTHGMLGSIADKLGPDFAPFLPHAAEAAFASCSQAGTWRSVCLSTSNAMTDQHLYHPGPVSKSEDLLGMLCTFRKACLCFHNDCPNPAKGCKAHLCAGRRPERIT